MCTIISVDISACPKDTLNLESLQNTSHSKSPKEDISLHQGALLYTLVACKSYGG